VGVPTKVTGGLGQALSFMYEQLWFLDAVYQDADVASLCQASCLCLDLSVCVFVYTVAHMPCVLAHAA